MLVNFNEFCFPAAEFDMSLLQGKGWKPGLPEDQDPRCAGIQEVNIVATRLDSYLLPLLYLVESYAPWDKVFCRVRAADGVRCGANVAMGLYQEFHRRLLAAQQPDCLPENLPEESILEKLFYANGVREVCFFGDIFLSAAGNKTVVTLRRFDTGNWYLRRLMSWHNFTQGICALMVPEMDFEG